MNTRRSNKRITSEIVNKKKSSAWACWVCTLEFGEQSWWCILSCLPLSLCRESCSMIHWQWPCARVIVGKFYCISILSSLKTPEKITQGMVSIKFPSLTLQLIFKVNKPWNGTRHIFRKARHKKENIKLSRTAREQKQNPSQARNSKQRASIFLFMSPDCRMLFSFQNNECHVSYTHIYSKWFFDHFFHIDDALTWMCACKYMYVPRTPGNEYVFKRGTENTGLFPVSMSLFINIEHVCVYVCTQVCTCMELHMGAFRGQKRTLGPLELEL